MDNKYVFVGNRAFVLERAIELGIPFDAVFAVKDSYLAKFCDENKISYHTIQSKAQLIERLREMDFDYLISNGLPYILPISELSKSTTKKFVNIHPSHLPDLGGRTPINGAILYGRDAGAACHYMDDGIDTGLIISRVKIPYSSDLDASLLYQLSFRAEADVFELAYKNNFVPFAEIAETERRNAIYFSRTDGDQIIDPLEDDCAAAERKFRAFKGSALSAQFNLNGSRMSLRELSSVRNSYVDAMADNTAPGSIILDWKDCEGHKSLVKMRDGSVAYVLFK